MIVSDFYNKNIQILSFNTKVWIKFDFWHNTHLLFQNHWFSCFWIYNFFQHWFLNSKHSKVITSLDFLHFTTFARAAPKTLQKIIGARFLGGAFQMHFSKCIFKLLKLRLKHGQAFNSTKLYSGDVVLRCNATPTCH